MIVVPDVTSTCMERKRSREPVVGPALDRAEIVVSEPKPEVEPRIGKSGLVCF